MITNIYILVPDVIYLYYCHISIKIKDAEDKRELERAYR
jgi:hypothetical protein